MVTTEQIQNFDRRSDVRGGSEQVVDQTEFKDIRPENGESSAVTGPIQRRNGYMNQKGRRKGPVEDQFMKVIYRY